MKKIIALSVIALLSANTAQAEDAVSNTASGAAAVPVQSVAPVPAQENLAPAPVAIPVPATPAVTEPAATSAVTEPAATPAVAEPAKPVEHLTPAQRAIQAEKAPIDNGALPTDPADVVDLKTKAVGGDTDAQHQLGVLYGEGQGDVARDYDQAIKWHRMAANNAEPDSQHYMGFAYENGIGVTRNYVTASEWYLKAATQGNAPSQDAIGVMYAKGTGVEQDYQSAYIWLSLAKKGGEETHAKMIDEMRKHVPGRLMHRTDGLIAAWQPQKGDKAMTGGGKIDFGN